MRASLKARGILRRLWPVCAVLLAGCSTAPIADLLDFFRPSRIRTDGTAPYGGVCIPQGGPVVAAPVPVVPPAGAPGPGVPVPPPPAPPSATPPVAPPPAAPGGNLPPITSPF